MTEFYGFDLGDAESAIARIVKGEQEDPKVLPLRGEESFVTAYAQTGAGELLIGESACYAPGAVRRKLRFKSRFLTDSDSEKDLKSFAGGVLGELYADAALIKGSENCFYIGCPAGWSRNERERYREIFEAAGYPPVRIISESRAALVSACQSRHLQIGHDILSKPVLVIDIGSSTTDFAYIMNGKEVELQTGGEVALGGGIMDEILLEECVKASPQAARIRKIFEESEPWKTYCEFAARRLKEKYFSDEAFWNENECAQSVTISYRLPVRLRLVMDAAMARALTEKGSPRLGGKSFRKVFVDSLREVRKNISGQQPELVFLTGGVSRLPMIRTWCEEIFPEAVVIRGADPAFSVAKGLAWCGRIDEDLREFRREVEQFIASDKVERIVKDHIRLLYRSAVDAMVEPVLENAALPVFDRWRDGKIRRLADVDKEMAREIETWLKTEEARKLLVKPITQWLGPVAQAIEDHTVPICVRHNVPYQALSLSSYLNLSDIDIRIEAKDVFAVEEITWLIDAIVSVLVGLLCGGSGVALISSGLPGVAAGAVLSLLVLFLGKDKMEGALLSAVIPKAARKVIPRSYFRSRIKGISSEVKMNFYDSLEKDKNEEITDRMVEEISQQIETCLTKMAEVVEIPLG